MADRALQNFVNGKYVDVSDGRTSDVIDPSTGEVYAQAPVSSRQDVDAAMQAAAAAFEGWRDTTPSERSLAMFRIADAMEKRADDIVAAETRNTGKPVALTASEEIPPAVDQIRFFAGAARVLEGRSAGEYMKDHTSMIRREPIGVCAQVTPWNYPMMMAVWKFGPAIAAGNTIVLKPSDTTPVSTLLLAEIAAEFLPPGVFNVVCGDRDTGRELISHPTPSMVSITGSVRAGMEVARTAADDLKRVHLELGGKAPVIVFDDADIQAVAETLKFASFWNSGQDCTAATRVIAGPKVYDDFMGALIEQVESIKVGDPSESDDIDMGPVVSANQQQRVLGFLDRATSAGATVATGGEAIGDRGFYIKPTVVTGADQKSEIIQSEVFGPVVTVQQFADDDQAIAWANDVEYGLAASVWTQSAKRGLNAVRKLQYGCVWLNDHFTVFNEMPHGGFKQSGYGKDMSKYGLDDYTIVKHVLAKFE